MRWAPSTDNIGVTSYRLWRGGTLAGTTTSTSVRYTGLACGKLYQLGVEAIDAAGNVSPPEPADRLDQEVLLLGSDVTRPVLTATVGYSKWAAIASPATLG